MPALTYNPIIVALDVEDASQAFSLIDSIGAHVDFYKVGMELFTAEGPALVRELSARGKNVFLDLKFHDIHETVRRAVARATELNVQLLTVHATGQVMRAAVEGRGSTDTKALAVTVLTSLGEPDLLEDGYPQGQTVAALVEKKVHLGVETGIDGFVCSPLEVAKVRAICGPQRVLVTPGVRSAGSAQGDQKRVATPGAAILAGSTYLVIGRQITRATDPAAEALKIREEIASA